jgi:hypothetical protein
MNWGAAVGHIVSALLMVGAVAGAAGCAVGGVALLVWACRLLAGLLA